jgi:hypothetical protein
MTQRQQNVVIALLLFVAIALASLQIQRSTVEEIVLQSIVSNGFLPQSTSISATLAVEGMPAAASHHVSPNRTTIVIYSGPTSMDRQQKKNELYLRNFDFFLKYGLDCQHQDTVMTLGSPVKDIYNDQLQTLDRDCAHRWGRRLFVVEREPLCYDMETMRVLMYEQQQMMPPLTSYRYLVYINCGMTGPAPELSHGWANLFTKHLSNKEGVAMTGISLNCLGVAHVQSYAFALDQAGLAILYEKDVVFDCRNRTYEGEPQRRWKRLLFRDIVKIYERGMSYHILRKRMKIRSIIPQWEATVTRKNYTKCKYMDPWNYEVLNDTFGGRMPTLKEVIFFKTSRFLTKELGDLIQYPGEPKWHQKRAFEKIRPFLGYPYNATIEANGTNAPW